MDLLEKLVGLHPLPAILIEYRHAFSFYTKQACNLTRYAVHNSFFGMSRVYARQLVRLQHSSKQHVQIGVLNELVLNIQQTSSPTGRLAVQDPNLQSIPHTRTFRRSQSSQIPQGSSQGSSQVDDDQEADGDGDGNGGERGERDVNTTEINWRSVFVAAPGCVLLAADYSQLEIRLMAHFSRDVGMTEILQRGGDVFKYIASTWLDKQPEHVSGEERAQAKSICYGILYGMGAQAFAERIKRPVEEAWRLKAQFLVKYPRVDEYLKWVVAQCLEHGYVETICGRRRYLAGISSPSADERSRAERQAVNTISQGSAADMVKYAMIRIRKRLRRESELPLVAAAAVHHGEATRERAFMYAHALPQVRLLLQIHDELLFEVPIEHLERVKAIVREEMETCVPLRVPATVRLSVGPSWGEMVPVE